MLRERCWGVAARATNSRRWSPTGRGDSRKGKVMEKEGGVLKNEGLVAKGQEKREVARGTEKE